MNIFYAEPSQIRDGHIELQGQEARHASKVLRYRPGDPITVVDGIGGWYDGTVSRGLRDTVQVKVERKKTLTPPNPERVVAFGIIKKRDRIEFAVEKAVECGVSELVLFRGEHSEKENVRMDRLESTVLSAMKQSLRAHLPAVRLMTSLQEVVEAYPEHRILTADQEGGSITEKCAAEGKYLLIVGPEGGLSPYEFELLEARGAIPVALGRNRLRTETAVVVFLSRFPDSP